MYEGSSSRAWDAARVDDLLPALAVLGGDSSVGDAELLAQLTALERLKAGAAAAQARVTETFARSQEQAAAATREAAKGQGFEAWQAGRDAFRGSHGIAAQVAFARRLSPWQGSAGVSFARALTHDLPAALAALSAGLLSERRAQIVARETSHLLGTDRATVDAQVCGDVDAVGRLGDRAIERTTRAAAYRLDPQGAVERARAAEAERRVSLRPQPDTMCRLSALLPLAQGVGVYAALSRDADSARAAGDARSRGQVMADTLVERVTGQAAASDVPVEVQVVLTDSALLGVGDGAEDPAQLVGFGSVPAGWARDLIAAELPTGAAEPTRAAQVWLRRLYASPDATTLVAMESSRRLFDAGLRRFLIARDGTCRTPWCDAPIRHLDHVRDHTRSGPTSTDNGQGLCERCNHTKQSPGWDVSVVDDRAGPHTVRWRTPTGATYDSTAPPLLPGAAARIDISTLETALTLALAA
jgi:hypothetical protein